MLGVQWLLQIPQNTVSWDSEPRPNHIWKMGPFGSVRRKEKKTTKKNPTTTYKYVYKLEYTKAKCGFLCRHRQLNQTQSVYHRTLLHSDQFRGNEEQMQNEEKKTNSISQCAGRLRAHIHKTHINTDNTHISSRINCQGTEISAPMNCKVPAAAVTAAVCGSTRWSSSAAGPGSPNRSQPLELHCQSKHGSVSPRWPSAWRRKQ